MAEEKKVLIRVEDVKMHFPIKKKSIFNPHEVSVKAVDGVSLEIHEGETLGLVGESGCGKSTLGRVILQLYKQTSGKVIYDGKDLSTLSKEEMRKLRKDLQIVFQDPYSSLNPRLTVGNLISEALVAHGIMKKGSKELEDYTLDIMDRCGLQNYMLHRYAHQFSGGQRQRIGIARALALKPRFIVCDEAVSALDVSIQSQIINLLIDLKEQEHLTYLFISHDLSAVKFISDRVGVMYLGNMVELADSDMIFAEPLHPYTQALLEAIPTTEENSNKELQTIEGDIPSPVNPPSGCKFHTRCKFATEKCSKECPAWHEHRPGHYVACHYPLLEKTVSCWNAGESACPRKRPGRSWICFTKKKSSIWKRATAWPCSWPR